MNKAYWVARTSSVILRRGPWASRGGSTEWTGYYRQRMYHGLKIASSLPSTGDLMDGEILSGGQLPGDSGDQIDAL